MDDALLRRLDLIVTLLGGIVGAIVAIAFLAWGVTGGMLVASVAFLFGIGTAVLAQPGEQSAVGRDTAPHED